MGKVQNIVFNMTVCLSTCIPQKPHVQTSRNFSYILIVAVAQSFSDNDAIRYVLHVLPVCACCWLNLPKFVSSIFAGHRCHKSLFRTCTAAQHPKFYNLQVHFDEAYTIHLTQFSLVISHCSITFSLFQLSQGSVATLIRWGGLSSYRHMYHSSLNLTAKLCIKIRWLFTKSQTKISWLLFMAHGVVVVVVVVVVVMFSHSRAYVTYGETYGHGKSVRGRQQREEQSFNASAPPVCALPPTDWHPSAVSLAIHDAILLMRQTMSCVWRQSLLSLTALSVFTIILIIIVIIIDFRSISLSLLYNSTRSLFVFCLYCSNLVSNRHYTTGTLAIDGMAVPLGVFDLGGWRRPIQSSPYSILPRLWYSHICFEKDVKLQLTSSSLLTTDRFFRYVSSGLWNQHHQPHPSLSASDSPRPTSHHLIHHSQHPHLLS